MEKPNEDLQKLKEKENYIKISLLFDNITLILREKFIERWKELYSLDWKMDSPDPASSQKYFTCIGNRVNFSKFESKIKKKITTESIKNWDITILRKVLIESDYSKIKDQPTLKQEQQAIIAIAQLRNQFAHSDQRLIDENQFKKLLSEFNIILQQLKLNQERIKKILESLDEIQASTTKTPTQKGMELKEQGNELYKKENFEESVQLYTQALIIKELSNEEKGTIYSNRSASYLKLAEKPPNSQERIQFGLSDGLKAIELRPDWWRGYHRAAECYMMLEKFEDAFLNYNQAIEKDPSKIFLIQEKDKCLSKMTQRNRNEHLDPLKMPKTLEEISQDLIQKGFTKDVKNFVDMTEFLLPGNQFVYEGHRCLYGWEVKQDFSKAAEFYYKASELGNAEGIYNYALLLKDGKGITQNITLAVEYLRKAAEMSPFYQEIIPVTGVAEAQHLIGLLYFDGVGVPQDFLSSIYWYKKSSDNGCSGGSHNLGLMYQRGLGVEKNINKAEEYFILAAKKDNVLAMAELVEYYMAEMEPSLAEKWFLLAVEKGYTPYQLIKEDFYQKLEKVKKVREPLEVGLMQWEANLGLVTKGLTFLERFKKSLEPPKEINRSSHLMNINRHITLKKFRENLIVFPQSNQSSNFSNISWTHQPKFSASAPKKLSGLKEITLRQMDPTKDKVYDGYILELTVIEGPKYGFKSIHLIGEDQNGDVERVFIYNLPQNKESLKLIGYGCKFIVMNPYHRIAADGLAGIRVDDTYSLSFVSKVEKMCRFCGKENATLRCSKCKKSFYCSNYCQEKDWTLLSHKSVCDHVQHQRFPSMNY